MGGGRSSASGLTVGTPVLCSFTSCGSCRSCSAKLPTKCPSVTPGNLRALRLADSTTAATLSTDGATPVSAHFFGQSSFSRLAVVSEKSIVKCEFPDRMDLYAPMGCGYQTGAGTVINILKPGPEDSVLIFGVGSVGMAALMACGALGVGKVIAVDVVQGKLEVARQLLGGITAINAKEVGDVVEQVKKVTGGRGASFAIDTTGVGKVVEDMLECLAAGGTAASVGAPPPGEKITVDAGAFFHATKKWVGVIEGDSYPPEVRELSREKRKNNIVFFGQGELTRTGNLVHTLLN